MIAYPILYVEEPQNQQKRDPVVRVCVRGVSWLVLNE